MDYTNQAIGLSRCIPYLEKIKQKPFKKIALVTQPPDIYEEAFTEFRKQVDLIQIPTMLTEKTLLSGFYGYFGLEREDPHYVLQKLSDYNFYTEFSAKHAEYVFMKMAEMNIYKDTMYHVPVQPIAYNDYFDHVFVLTNDGIDEVALKHHADEEGFEYESELSLIKIQRKYYEECLTHITSA